MRRTLTVLVTAGAFLVPAGAASAADTHQNASCSNGKGGNYGQQRDIHTYNNQGNYERATSTGCESVTVDGKLPGYARNAGAGGGSGADPIENEPV